MRHLDLLENERLITESDNEVVSLTSHRIIYYEKEFGKARLVSIMLEKVSSVEMQYKSNILWFICGLLFAIGGLLIGHQSADLMLVLFAVAVLFTLLYLSTRRHLMVITSDGGTKIWIACKGMKHQGVLRFASQIDRYKYEKYRNQSMLV